MKKLKMIKSIRYRSDLLRKNLIQKRQIDNIYSLDEVAKMTNISKATLSRIEKGKHVDLLTFANLCDWLKTEPNDYFEIVRERQDGIINSALNRAFPNIT